MPESQHTFGDFFDEMYKLASEHSNIDAQFFMEDWVQLVSPERWQEVRKMPLTVELILPFADDMAKMFWDRISTIDGEELYEMTKKDGHAFLRAICSKAKELGFELDEKEVDRPLTFSDVAVATGFATEQGAKEKNILQKK